MQAAFGLTRSFGYGAFANLRKLLVAIALSVSAANAETVTIAALGDSLTQGFGLAKEDGFIPQLGRWLEENGADATLINAGVSGDTSTGGLARANWTLTPNVDALIVTLGGNDLLRGLDPSLTRANLTEILEIANAKGVEILLVGMTAPGNFGPEYKASFDQIYPDLARDFETLFYPSFMTSLAALSGDGSLPLDYMQADNIHPNRDGVAIIVSDIGPFVLDLISRVESKNP
jgi:acyl-CoA thioesterase-1